MTTMLLEWVATAVFLILAVLLLRAVFGKRVGAGLRYALWGAVLLRLLIPVQLFTSPLAGMVFTIWPEDSQSEDATPAGDWTAPFLGTYQPDTPFPTGPAFDHELPGTFPSEIHFLEPPPVPAAPEAPDAPEAPGPDWFGWAVLGVVWLAGGAVTALVFLGCNLRFRRRLRRVRVPLEEAQAHDETRAHNLRPYTTLPVYTAEGLPSPCLFGLVRPAIYVTPETAADPAALRHVLAHEDTHFRHGDHIWNLLRCAALCLHWWNPLVWLSAALSRRDGELACDEGALKRLGDGERAAYGATLLTLITAPSDPVSLLRCATTMAGDKKSLVERVSRIARAPKKWLWAAVAAALCLSLACVCAFGQKAEEPEPSNRPDIPAELSFYVAYPDDDHAYVRINGTVDGMELPREAIWYPNGTGIGEFAHQLSMGYPGFEGPGHDVIGRWTDEDHTSVTLSTYMSAGFSSLFNVGYWEFTVDLDSGAVTAMEGLPRDALLNEETVFYPESISDEEAVRAARVAAKLMEEAEACYNRIKALDGAAPSENAPDDGTSPEPSATPREEPGPSESAAPEETSNPPESPDPEETNSSSGMEGHFGGMMEAMAEEAKPRRPAEDVAGMTELPFHPDLNRNGVPERLLQGQYYQDRQQTASMPGVGVWEGDELLWTSTNKDAPSSSWAFLLVEQEDGDLLERGDYLMEYRAWIGNTNCTYDIIVYDLTQETEYYVDGASFYYSSAEEVAQVFDTENIAEFKGKADALLSKSSVLMDTPGIFTGKKLKMDLSWLDFHAAGFTWDDSATDLENLTRFKEAATAPQQSAAPAGAAQNRAALRSALLGETKFTYCAPGSPAQAEIGSVAHMAFESLSDEWGKIYQFSVVDLDGDGAQEAVLHVIDAAGDAGGYLVFRRDTTGDVRCYSLTTYDFRELKADGTFGYAVLKGMMGDPGGYGRASFPAPGYSLVTRPLMEGKMGWSIGPAYYINGQEVTDEEYAAAKAQQDAKPDAAWYEFTAENIKTVLG